MDTGTVNIFSLEECLKIVKNALKLTADKEKELKIQSYEVKRGSNDLLGFMGEYYKLKVYLEVEKQLTTKTVNGGGGTKQLQYFVKTVPLQNEYHKNECERKGFFGKETRIYTEILPNIQRYASSKLFAECYYTRSDLIVMEDLSISTDGLRQLTEHESYTEAHYKVMLNYLSKLHAASIAWELDEKLNIGERFKDVLFEMVLATSNEWYVTGIKGIIFLAQTHTKFQTPKIQKFINEKLYKILCNTEQLTEPSKQFHNVLCHRDLWDRNIFFKFNKAGTPIDSCTVDFQLTRYSPPAIDILFFIYATTTRTQREKIYDTYLNYYHESLRSALRNLNIDENLITKEEFLADCRYARLSAMIMMAICEPLIKMPKGLANKMRAAEQDKFDFYMNEKRDEMFTRIIEICPEYREIIMAPIEEMLEYLLENEDVCEMLC